MSLGLVISPAKRMDVVDAPDAEPTSPLFLDRTVELMRVVQALDPAAQQALWRTGDELTRLSRERFSAMDECALRDASALTPAVLSFHGIQYQHLAARVMDSSQLAWLDAHLRILSGFYGLLRPGDGVMPYRLEMGARLATGGHRDLYGFWGRALADELARGADVIVNLASVEYARAVTPFLPDTPARLVTCLFATLVDGRLLQRATEAKAARGTFVRWCAEEGAEELADLGSFCERGYHLDEGRSDAGTLVFVRQDAPTPADAASGRREASWWLMSFAVPTAASTRGSPPTSSEGSRSTTPARGPSTPAAVVPARWSIARGARTSRPHSVASCR